MTRDRSFYKQLTHLMLVVVLQNVVTYSINMADNLMLGSYSETALSGAFTVNMIQFIVQQLTFAFADSVVILGSQYWGKGEKEPVKRIIAIGLWCGIFFGLLMCALTSLCGAQILGLFTEDEAIIGQGLAYLELIRFTYPLFILTTILMAALRCIGTVNISFGISCGSLVLDVCINYTLIFGHFGFPEMGIRGAAVGTLAARIFELSVIVLYLLFRDKKLRLFAGNPLRIDRIYIPDYWKVLWPSLMSQLLWSIATPVQTGILGHMNLNGDAIAANSVATTVFQYLKVVAVGESSSAAVITGQSVGRDSDEKIKEYARTLQVIFIILAVVMSTALFFIRIPLLQFYNLSGSTEKIANDLLILMCFIYLGMAYQFPAGSGIVKAGGDVKYLMVLNFVSTWLIVMPLSFAAAFWFKWPVVAVVACLNSDQVFKCLPTAIRVNRFKWINHLTREKA